MSTFGFRRIFALLVTWALVGCTTTSIDPVISEIESVKVPRFEFAASLEVRGLYTDLGGRELEISGGANVKIVEDNFTTVLVAGVREELERHGAVLDPDAGHVVEIQVVHVSIHPGPSPPTACVIDYNVRLGDGLAHGFQSRGGSSFNGQERVTSFDNAATQAVIDILNSGALLSYLEVTR